MAHDDASDGDDKSGDGIGLCSATMLLMTIVCLNLSVVVGVHRILWLNNSPNARKANKQTNETGKESIQHLHCSTTRHEQKLSETNFPDYSLEYFSSSPPLEFTTLTQFSSQLCAPFQVVGICCVADSWVAHFPAFLIEWNYTVFNECVYVLSHHIDGHVQQFICLYMPSQGSDWGASSCCAYTSIQLQDRLLLFSMWTPEWVNGYVFCYSNEHYTFIIIGVQRAVMLAQLMHIAYTMWRVATYSRTAPPGGNWSAF